MWIRLLDACVFSSLWLAAAAAALAAAASHAMGVAPDPRALGLAAAGTLVIYNVDRLRDLDRDRTTSPERTAFVERHRATLRTLTAAAGVTSAALAVSAGRGPIALLLPALGAGLLHRRLKRFALAKPLYVVACWLLVVAGLPWILAQAPSHTGWVLASIGSASLANAIASNIRDEEAGAALLGAPRALALARGFALLGVTVALVGPAPVQPLAWVPATVLAALLRFRPTERYGLAIVDGALLVGALVALAVAATTPSPPLYCAAWQP